jgi:Ser/Thr protein kinase RdoA (MazF antagonist)
LMEEQTKNSPPPMNQEEIKTLEAILLEALTHLENLHLPDTLGHLDFNPGNILVSGHRVVFLDWSAAGVGCPFVTIEYLLERLCRLRPSLQASWRNEVLSAYLQRYRFFLQPQELAAALATTPLIAVFAYAVASGAWSAPGRRRDPETAAHLRSLTRRMYREAQLWIRSSGSLCRRLG